MKNVSYYIALLLLYIVLFTGCDGWKWDENGDLDGLWQLTEWHDKTTGNVSMTKNDELYYSVQLKLLKIQKMDKSGYYFSYFTNTGDSLFLEAPVHWPEDEKRPLSELAPYGVPANGHFHIDVLNSKNMVLSSTTAILSFRKY